MPNKRKKNKKSISVYVRDEVKDKLAAMARERGITLAQLCKEIYRAELIRRGIKLESETDE